MAHTRRGSEKVWGLWENIAGLGNTPQMDGSPFDSLPSPSLVRFTNHPRAISAPHPIFPTTWAIYKSEAQQWSPSLINTSILPGLGVSGLFPCLHYLAPESMPLSTRKVPALRPEFFHLASAFRSGPGTSFSRLPRLSHCRDHEITMSSTSL